MVFDIEVCIRLLRPPGSLDLYILAVYNIQPSLVYLVWAAMPDEVYFGWYIWFCS